MGLDAFHQLTKGTKTKLKISLDWMKGPKEKQISRVVYDGFSVGEAATFYKLSIGT